MKSNFNSKLEYFALSSSRSRLSLYDGVIFRFWNFLFPSASGCLCLQGLPFNDRNRGDFRQSSHRLNLSPQVDGILKVEPKFHGRAEFVRQENGSACCDGSLSAADFVDTPRPEPGASSELGLSETHGTEKVFEEDLARRCGRSCSWQSARKYHGCSLRMVIDNLNLSKRVSVGNKENSELIVDADSLESGQIALFPFKAISRRNFKVFKTRCARHLVELSPGNSVKLSRENLQGGLRLSRLVNIAACLVGKFQHHSIPALPLDVKRISPYTRLLLLASSCIIWISCVSRAPTKCELDKRSGLYSTSYCDEGQAQSSLASQSITTTSVVSKSASLPVREDPVVAKVWVARLAALWTFAVSLQDKLSVGLFQTSLFRGAVSLFMGFVVARALVRFGTGTPNPWMPMVGGLVCSLTGLALLGAGAGDAFRPTTSDGRTWATAASGRAGSGVRYEGLQRDAQGLRDYRLAHEAE